MWELSLHSAVLKSRTQLAVRSYSTALSMSKAQVSVLKDDFCFDDTGFVTCRYASPWWLGCLLDNSADTEEVTISFLHPCSLAPSFVYPRNPDVLVTHRTTTSILTKVDPTTATGRTYTNLVPQSKRLPPKNLHSTGRYVISCTVAHPMRLNWLTLLRIQSLRMSLKTGIFKH